jgi:hypothetical protein
MNEARLTLTRRYYQLKVEHTEILMGIRTGDKTEILRKLINIENALMLIDNKVEIVKENISEK